MAVPPTLVMSVNVMFVVGAVSVPGLWSLVEYLFQAALVGFLAIGAFALRLYGRYLVQMITTATFDLVANAPLSQRVPTSTFAMIAVGVGASGAMSQAVAINAIGIFLAIFFLSLSVVLGIVRLVLSIASILQRGLDANASPSLRIDIPILTLLGIAAIRLIMACTKGSIHRRPIPPSSC